MGRLATTFPKQSEFETSRDRLQALGLPFEVVTSLPGYRRVGVPALVMEPEARSAMAQDSGRQLVCSGWVDYRAAAIQVPAEEPPEFAEDVFGEAAVMVLAPCIADETKIRIIAHIPGNMEQVFPYMNAVMREACYNVHGPTFTFMDRYRMVSLYPRRIAVAKADEIVDAWRTLEAIRLRVNGTWARRKEIEPCYELREKPPALEIFKRLPRTNCGECGQKTCLAFAVELWRGLGSPAACKPVFAGEYTHMKDALMEICAGLGVMDQPVEEGV